MAGRRRSRRNPFFVALMVVSTLFVMTCLGYLIGPFARQATPEIPDAQRGGMAEWLDRRGPMALAVEFAIMGTLAVLAMATEGRFTVEAKEESHGHQPGPGPS